VVAPARGEDQVRGGSDVSGTSQPRESFTVVGGGSGQQIEMVTRMTSLCSDEPSNGRHGGWQRQEGSQEGADMDMLAGAAYCEDPNNAREEGFQWAHLCGLLWEVCSGCQSRLTKLGLGVVR
jgi:hypothetical protein